jgi:predicted hydrolase (HD superfamily)
MPERADAWELLCEYAKGESLRRHALAVETAMRACAARYGDEHADAEEWGLVGLLHDFDYEMFPAPDQHPFTGANILCGRGYSERIIRAIMGHATYTGVPRDTDMARALFATDELCGFLVACALVRPSRSLDDMEVSSVKKKLKDKAFARSVNRDDIKQGVEELGVSLDEHIRFVIDALRPVQKEIGLNTSSA